MVPIASYLLLRGRCRHCGESIAPDHLWIELAATAIAATAVAAELYAGGDMARVAVDCALGWTLLALGWIDARHFLLPDVLTLPLAPAGLAWTWYADPALLTWNAGAGVAGYLLFRLIEVTYLRWRGIAGLGQGDAKLMAAIGCWVGPAGMGPVLLFAALGALIGTLAARLRGAEITRRTRLPFGAALAAAGWVVFLVY